MNSVVMKPARSLAAASALAAFLLVGSPHASAQPAAGGDYAKRIQGTWSLVSQYGEQDGKRIDTFGASPRGMMILTPEGRYTVVLMRESLPKFASNNRVKGTADENGAVVAGSIAYFGTYSIVSEKDQLVGLKLEGSTFPNWDGQDQKRVMVVEGDEMKVTNPTAAIGGQSFVFWKRVR
jgi:hypothetical protein